MARILHLAEEPPAPPDETRWWEMQLGVGIFGSSARQRRELAQRKVASDLRRRGYAISTPTTKDCRYDLVVDRAGTLERVRVRHSESDELAASDLESIDLLAMYDRATDRCYYSQPGSGARPTTKI